MVDINESSREESFEQETHKIPPEHKRLIEQTWVPIIGSLVSFFEFLITAVYQFYFLGFALSLGMWFGSSVYLYLKWRDYKIWKGQEKMDPNHTKSLQVMMLA